MSIAHAPPMQPYVEQVIDLEEVSLDQEEPEAVQENKNEWKKEQQGSSNENSSSMMKLYPEQAQSSQSSPSKSPGRSPKRMKQLNRISQMKDLNERVTQFKSFLQEELEDEDGTIPQRGSSSEQQALAKPQEYQRAISRLEGQLSQIKVETETDLDLDESIQQTEIIREEQKEASSDEEGYEINFVDQETQYMSTARDFDQFEIAPSRRVSIMNSQLKKKQIRSQPNSRGPSIKNPQDGVGEEEHKNEFEGYFSRPQEINELDDAQVDHLRQELEQHIRKSMASSGKSMTQENIFEQNFKSLLVLDQVQNGAASSDLAASIDSLVQPAQGKTFSPEVERRALEMNQIRLTSAVRIKQEKESKGLMNSVLLQPEMKGELQKYSPALFSRWQNRYVVLKDRKIKYYKVQNKEDPKSPQGVLNFDQFKFTCEPDTSDANVFYLTIKGITDRKFEFKAKTKDECKEWISKINSHILASRGHRLDKTAGDLSKPWKFDTISEEQFYEKADTGDILLFRTKSASGNLIRTLTSSQFDHVAMVLKFETDDKEIYLVEATGNFGVAINKWSLIKQVVGTNAFYERVIYRHVNFRRDDPMIDSLEVFLKETVGQKYGMNSKKLMRRVTQAKKDGSGREIIDEDRTFFCSELVAKGFKVLGILEDSNISSSQFYPVHFSSKGDSFLKLTQGTRIGDEMQILVDDERSNSASK